MNLEELHAKGYEFYKAKNFDAALKIADELQRLDPKYKLGYYLEAAVWHELDNSFKEYCALKKILPLLEFSSPEEKKFAIHVLSNVRSIFSKFCLSKELKEICELISQLDTCEAFDWLKLIIFHSNAIENLSAADFKKLYDE